jgi:outer membrane protein TolC
MGMIRPHRPAALCVGITVVLGCQQRIIDRTDREVYSLIEGQQRAALGTTSDVHVGAEAGELADTERMYRFNPRPITAEVPESFRPKTAPAESAPAGPPVGATTVRERLAAETDLSPDIFTPEERPKVRVFGLVDTLGYAMHHARTLQDAKEALYLAALDLTLERHLWTPQFVGSIQARADFADAGGLHDYDRAMETVSDLTLTQRLPYGGSVSAQVISTLVRDLEEHVTSGESGSLILDADIPLLRGAGRVAYESRYSAEREMIYAVRTYERFRRSFLVEVAAAYFNLQQAKAAINNTYTAYESRIRDWEKADFKNRMGRSDTIFEAPRAKSSLRQAESALVSTKERYATALDRVKIFIGMPVGELLDVVGQEDDEKSKALDNLLPEVDVATAVEVALKYRLDLLSEVDRVDDSRRGVHIARNRILPDLDFTASVAFDSDPDHLSAVTFNTERHAWGAGLELRMDDRKTERNAYRAALVAVRQAARDHEQFVDTVIADVRRAIRRIVQQENLRRIQALNVEENEFRLEAARAQFDLGKKDNQDVVDAENDLLDARNDYASAVAAYRNAILEFRLDTGTLRVTDEGRWDQSSSPTPQPVD